MQYFWIRSTVAVENFDVFYMFGGSHSCEGLYTEWHLEGRDEPEDTAHGEDYRKRESQRRKAKDEKVKNIDKLIFT